MWQRQQPSQRWPAAARRPDVAPARRGAAGLKAISCASDAVCVSERNTARDGQTTYDTPSAVHQDWIRHCLLFCDRVGEKRAQFSMLRVIKDHVGRSTYCRVQRRCVAEPQLSTAARRFQLRCGVPREG